MALYRQVPDYGVLNLNYNHSVDYMNHLNLHSNSLTPYSHLTNLRFPEIKLPLACLRFGCWRSTQYGTWSLHLSVLLIEFGGICNTTLDTFHMTLDRTNIVSNGRWLFHQSSLLSATIKIRNVRDGRTEQVNNRKTVYVYIFSTIGDFTTSPLLIFWKRNWEECLQTVIGCADKNN